MEGGTPGYIMSKKPSLVRVKQSHLSISINLGRFPDASKIDKLKASLKRDLKHVISVMQLPHNQTNTITGKSNPFHNCKISDKVLNRFNQILFE